MRDHCIFVASFALLLLQVASQTSNVTCVPSYQWSFNSNNQTPCLIAAFLESICEGPVEITTIPDNTHYAGPRSVSEATPCRCSTVTYSLISACGACQNRRFISWTEWATNCSQVEVAQFLNPIPPQVVVPPWAYLNVTKTNNIFNPILANQSLSQPTTSAVSTSSASSASSATSASTTFIPATVPTSPPPPESHKKSNAGAIAGGVVGGLAVMVAAGLGLLFYRHRRNRSLEESERFASSFSTSPPPMQNHGSRRMGASPLSITPFPFKEPFAKELSEAETIPGSPVMSAIHTTFDTPSVATPAVQILHRYTGSTEL
ncbi:hypothetical protein DFH09DRAFT_111009 [Mycena vulgaris]|nr:hypothetical protein DFH09DRAFT_111009 [Mycena vulgaris]